MTPSQPMPVPISCPASAADFSTLVGTPEFIQDLLYTPTGSAGACPSVPTAVFGSTPTNNYGFGSFGSVYPPPPLAPPLVSQQQQNGNADSLSHHHHHIIHGTPPSSAAAATYNAALYSTSPTGTFFSIPFHPPTGTTPQQYPMMTGLANQLNQMVLANPTRQTTANARCPMVFSGGSAGRTHLHHQATHPSLAYRSHLLDEYRNNRANNLQLTDLGKHVVEFSQDQPANARCPMVFSGGSAGRAHLHQQATHPSLAHRSHLLDEYRNNRASNLQLTDLGKHVVEFAQDQHGSRFIQQKLERASSKEKQAVFDEVIQHAQHLMTDVFGNYVIQKFFEYGTDEQKAQLMDALRGHVLTLALQMYGCRVIQKALESVDKTSQMEIINELSPQVIRCVKDQNGNHVVQKIIERVDSHQLQFVIDTMVNGFSDSVTSLSIHPYGCRVIQRVLEHCTEKQKRPVLEQLHENVLTLVTDQYGNYVIQHVIEHGLLDDRERIVRSLQGDILKYAQHKFASNVIEKCLICGTTDQKNALIDEICVDNGSSNPPLLEMMKDPFANYVVQKMLDVADSAHRKKMMFAIKGHIPALRRFNYGKHIITKLEKYFQKVSPMFQQQPLNNGSNNTTSSVNSSIDTLASTPPIF